MATKSTLAEEILDFAEHGDYSNGITGNDGTIDQGNVYARERIKEFRDRLNKLHSLELATETVVPSVDEIKDWVKDEFPCADDDEQMQQIAESLHGRFLSRMGQPVTDRLSEVMQLLAANNARCEETIKVAQKVLVQLACKNRLMISKKQWERLRQAVDTHIDGMDCVKDWLKAEFGAEFEQ